MCVNVCRRAAIGTCSVAGGSQGANKQVVVVGCCWLVCLSAACWVCNCKGTRHNCSSVDQCAPPALAAAACDREDAKVLVRRASEHKRRLDGRRSCSPGLRVSRSIDQLVWSCCSRRVRTCSLALSLLRVIDRAGASGERASESKCALLVTTDELPRSFGCCCLWSLGRRSVLPSRSLLRCT